MTHPPYVGRFAPSPTGPLHAGSLVAALASFLDARAHHGMWLVRVEDVDSPRCPPGMGDHQLWQLQQLGLRSDGPVIWQSQRQALYEARLAPLIASGAVYGCQCTRADIEHHWLRLGVDPMRHQARPYPGTCRQATGLAQARSWRFRIPSDLDGQRSLVHWTDRRLGPQEQEVDLEVGDFILKRADGLLAYQWAVVVDDQDQGVTHVVRGEDLADNTPRQILLQRALGAPRPAYLHTPLVRAPDGQKLSKQNGAQALEVSRPGRALASAAQVLGLHECFETALALDDEVSHSPSWQAWWSQAVAAWASRWWPG